MPPADHPTDDPRESGRHLVWTVGSDRAGARTPHPAWRWLTLLVVVGACSFLLAYAVHTLLGGGEPSAPAGSLWLPERLAPDTCSGS